ncbi:MAG: hypothetical protein NT062_07630 [Proteobacteria bacterium]|nr:hypothetical protein [Pseudomonadota bacterium]
MRSWKCRLSVRSVSRAGRGVIRPEVARVVVADVAHDLHAREPIALRRGVGLGLDEPQHEVLLVVAQLHVEARLVLLDQVVLEEQRLLRRRHHDRLDVVDQPREEARRDEEPLVAALAEVLPHADPEVLRLADVDHRALGVLEQVDARIGRDAVEQLVDGLARQWHARNVAPARAARSAAARRRT